MTKHQADSLTAERIRVQWTRKDGNGLYPTYNEIAKAKALGKNLLIKLTKMETFYFS